MGTAPCLSFPVLFLPGCSSHEAADGATRPHPSHGLIQGWDEHPQNSLTSCHWAPGTPFPSAGMVVLVLQLVTLPVMCQVWMSPVPGVDVTSETRGSTGVQRCTWLLPAHQQLVGKPEKSQNCIYLTF